MKALKDFKDERLSKREMGNVICGVKYQCCVTMGQIATIYHFDFTFQEMTQWVSDQLTTPGVTGAGCIEESKLEIDPGTIVKP